MKLRYPNSVALNYILSLVVIETFLINFLSYYSYSLFSIVPYVRIGTVIFTFLFFFRRLFNLKVSSITKINLTNEDQLLIIWLAISVIGFLVGIIRGNPMLYVITDFMYVLIGAIIYYMLKRQDLKLPDKIFLPILSLSFALLTYSIFWFGLEPPPFFLVVQAIWLYLLLLNRKFVWALILIFPFLDQISNSNRTQYFILFFLLIVFLLKILRRTFSKEVILLSFTTVVLLTFLFKETLIENVLELFDKKSNIGYRFYQIHLIFQNGLDYSNPFLISITQRLLEIKAVVDYWLSSPLNFVFGSGSGGVIDGTAYFSDNSVLKSSLMGESKIHNIHILPFSLIFRYGLFGLILFGLIIWFFIRYLIEATHSKRKNLDQFWPLFLMTWIIFSLPAASFLWTTPLFWMSLKAIKFRQNET